MSQVLYHPPYMPHELDLHPDRSRILATLEAVRDELQTEIDDAFDRGQKVVEGEVADLEYDIDDLKSEIEDLRLEIQGLETQLEVAQV